MYFYCFEIQISDTTRSLGGGGGGADFYFSPLIEMSSWADSEGGNRNITSYMGFYKE